MFSYRLIVLLFILKIVKGNEDYEVCDSPECNALAQSILSDMNSTVNPCDDAFMFSCGTIFNERNFSQKYWDVGKVIAENMKALLNGSEDSKSSYTFREAQKLYQVCEDVEAGTNPSLILNRYLKDTSMTGGYPMVLKSLWDGSGVSFGSLFAHMHNQLNVNFLVYLEVQKDVNDNKRNVIYLDQGSLKIPKRQLFDQVNYGEKVEKYKNYMLESSKVLRDLFGYTSLTDEEIQQSVDTLYDFEINIANIQEQVETLVGFPVHRNMTSSYHATTLGELKKTYPNLDFDIIFSKVFENQEYSVDDTEKVVVRTPHYFQRLDTLLNRTPKEVIANYAHWYGVLLPFGVNTTEDSYDPKPNCMRSSHHFLLGDNSLMWAVANEYNRIHGDKAVNTNGAKMVNTVKEAFKQNVEKLDWIPNQATKDKIKCKIDLVDVNVGDPDWIYSNVDVDYYYSTLEAFTDNHEENLLIIRRFESKKRLSHLREWPLDFWKASSAIANAFYKARFNSLYMPGGLFAPPFYHHNFPKAINYGAMGYVMGHEISHLFDDISIQYGLENEIENWLDDDFFTKYQEKVQCLKDQYRDVPIPNAPEGRLDRLIVDIAIGEIIADNAGLHNSFTAYKNYVKSNPNRKEQRLPGLTHYTEEQTFFLSFGHSNCAEYSDDSRNTQVTVGPHPPGSLRIPQAVANMEEFSNAFGCSTETRMNRGDDRCVIW